jgi:phosphate transport system protein
MYQLDKELLRVREHVIDMIDLVKLQIERAKTAMLSFDEALLVEVSATEKNINKLDVKIDNKCENILALYNPVAVDLRYVMACLSFNSFLERVGDNVKSIVRIGSTVQGQFTPVQLTAWGLIDMFDITLKMLDAVKEGIDSDDIKIVGETFRLDAQLDEIDITVHETLMDYAEQNHDKIRAAFMLYPIFRKMERVGDLITNISEELIFYIDAKVLRHKKTKKKIQHIEGNN